MKSHTSLAFFCLILLCTSGQLAMAGLNESQRAKLHPTFQILVEEWQQDRLASKADSQHEAIILTSHPEALTNAGIIVNSVYNGFVTARVRTEQLEVLASLEAVRFVDPGSTNELHAEVSVHETGAPLLHEGYDHGVLYRGEDVIVVIYDTGIDWKHLDFRSLSDPTQSRILAIWDQTLSAIGSEAPPAGFGYGVEYTQSQINDEIDGSPAGFVRESDIHGHGTHVAGSAAGNGGALGGKFVGMAPGADIVVVKGGNGSFGESGMIDGLTYAHNIASARGKPVVVNFSIGGQTGPHDGTRPYEVAIDQFSSNSGHAVVVSAGNDGANLMHVSRVISAGGTETITFTVPSYTPKAGTENDAFLFDLWCNGNNDITATVISPNGISYTRGTGQSGEGPVTTDGTITLYNAISSYNGHTNVQSWVHDKTADVPSTGEWTLSLTNNAGTSVTCHGWLAIKTVGSSTVTVTGGNTDRTVSMPATSAAAITVGSYMSKWGWPSYNGAFYTSGTDRTDNISTFSSIGPTRDDRQKPDIAAPGQWIASALSSTADTTGDYPYVQPGEKHWMMQGTSMAAPHVTGAVALLLGAGTNLMSTQIKSLLTTTALSDAYATSLPNPVWGYGKMDIFRALIHHKYPSAIAYRTLVAYDGVGASSVNSITGSNKAGVKFVAPVDGRLTAVRINVTTNVTSAFVGSGDAVVQVYAVSGGLPGAALGSPISIPFALLSRGTVNTISMLAANISLTTGTEYIVTLAVSVPGDELGLRADGLASPPTTSMWFDGSTWSLWSTGHLRIQSVITTDVEPLPVQLVDFGCSAATLGGVTLEWRTMSEVNNYGFTVQRKLKEEAVYKNVADGFLPGKGTTIEPQVYRFTDRTVKAAGTYAYRLEQQDLDGTISYSQDIVVDVTVTDIAEEAPKEFRLMQNYPNPFNPRTLLKFSVETKGRAQLVVYNVLGEQVATLFDETVEAGRYYESTFSGEKLPSGAYIARLTAGSRTGLIKLMLVR